MLTQQTPSFLWFAPDGHIGNIGGTGSVVGTAGFQYLSFAPQAGLIDFDASFNRGGDVLRLTGLANTYGVSRSGSSALLDNGTAQYLVPVGMDNIWLAFDDGFRGLSFDIAAEKIVIGSQQIGDEPQTLASPAENPGQIGFSDTSAQGMVFLSPGAQLTLGGRQSVFGTVQAEQITHLSGDLTLDASFNRGGDTLILAQTVSDYVAWRSGSSIVLQSDDSTITVPVGLAGSTIDFAGQPLNLYFDTATGHIRLGDRSITATSALEAQPISFSAVYIFGDSLVDAGNALGLAEWYDGLPLQDLPDGAPTTELGYFEGRFSDGYTYFDMVTNRFTGTPSEPIFPFNYKEPFLGIKISPFAAEPKGNNTNWAYGGAQIIRGGEAVPGLDVQTSAFRDAQDGMPDPGALYLVTMGGNDVRELAPHSGNVASEADAHADLDRAAARVLRELSQLFDLGARHFLITGIPDVGLIPRYDVDGNRVLDSDPENMGELERSQIATEYSIYLDTLIREEVVPALQELGANVTYVPLADVFNPEGEFVEQGVLQKILPTIAALHDLPLSELEDNLLDHQELIFFDLVHPNGQVHALVSAQILAQLDGVEAVEVLPFDPSQADFAQAGEISEAGEIDEFVTALTAGITYAAEVLGMSSLGRFGDLADPVLRIFAPDGTSIIEFAGPSGSDAGAGLDAHFQFTASESGDYRFEVGAKGAVTGNYLFQLGDIPADSMAFA